MNGQNTKDESEHFFELLTEIRELGQEGLKKFYSLYGEIITGTAKTFFHNEDEVNEVVNSILRKVWYFAKRQKKICNPKGWIYKMASNYAKDILRSKRRSPLPLNENIVAEKDEIEEFIDNDCFYSYIRFLEEDEQKILTYKFVYKYTFKEIAILLDKPISTISAMYYRATKKVKEKVLKARKDLEN